MSKRADLARCELEKGCDFFEIGDYPSAVKCFLIAAKSGSVEAQVNLANLYDKGNGVPKDFRMAAYWYKRAIRSGCCYGASGLGVAYKDRGQFRWAAYWLEKAVQLGDPWAKEELATLRIIASQTSDKGSPISRPVSSE